MSYVKIEINTVLSVTVEAKLEILPILDPTHDTMLRIGWNRQNLRQDIHTNTFVLNCLQSFLGFEIRSIGDDDDDLSSLCVYCINST